jgi:two-component system response regulator RegX3
MDEMFARLVSLTLRHGGFEVRATTDSDEAVELANTWRPQLAMVEGDSRRRDVEALAHVDQRGHFGLITFTRTRHVKVKLTLFELGVDDLIEPPFTPDEIIGRPIGLLGRLGIAAIPLTATVDAGGVRLDLEKERAILGKVVVPLNIEELAILYLLTANPDARLTREEIKRLLWGDDLALEDERLEAYLARLGGEAPSARLIETADDHFRGLVA